MRQEDEGSGRKRRGRGVAGKCGQEEESEYVLETEKERKGLK